MLICHCISVLVYLCMKGYSNVTHCSIHASQTPLWEIEMIMHDTSRNIYMRENLIKKKIRIDF
jgi:hypothetical protein